MSRTLAFALAIVLLAVWAPIRWLMVTVFVKPPRG